MQGRISTDHSPDAPTPCICSELKLTRSPSIRPPVLIFDCCISCSRKRSGPELRMASDFAPLFKVDRSRDWSDAPATPTLFLRQSRAERQREPQGSSSAPTHVPL